jgi:phosphoribosylanthranilate isomerase
MFRIKICGLTTPQDAVVACEAGADALGLNFYPASRRFISPQAARDIRAAIPRGAAQLVGVFVNASLPELLKAYDEFGLDALQLHGDEVPEMILALGERQVIRAFRCQHSCFRQVGSYLAACARLGRLPDAVLIDAYSSHEYGGTGQTADWPAVAAARCRWLELPLVLAGGLKPENVAEAIRATRPEAVDTASGVESAAGIKDPARIRRFIEQARRGWEGSVSP